MLETTKDPSVRSFLLRCLAPGMHSWQPAMQVFSGFIHTCNVSTPKVTFAGSRVQGLDGSSWNTQVPMQETVGAP